MKYLLRFAFSIVLAVVIVLVGCSKSDTNSIQFNDGEYVVL